MGKFSNYVIILRQIGPLYYYIEKGPANIKVRPINYTTHFNYVILLSLTYDITLWVDLAEIHSKVVPKMIDTDTRSQYPNVTSNWSCPRTG